MEFKELLTVLKRRAITIVAVFAVMFAGGAFYKVNETKVRYQATARLFILYDRIPVPGKDFETIRTLVPDGISMPTRELILASPEIHPRTAAVYLAYVDKAGAEGFDWKKLEIERIELSKERWLIYEEGRDAPHEVRADDVKALVGRLESAISAPQPVVQGEGNQVFRLTATAETAEYAALYVNAYVVAARSFSREESVRALDSAIGEYDRQIDTIDEPLQELRDQVQPEQVKSWQAEEALTLQEINALDRELTAMDADRAKNRRMFTEIEAELASAHSEVPSVLGPHIRRESDHVHGALRTERQEIEVRMAQKEQYWKEQFQLLQDLKVRAQTLSEQERREQVRLAAVRASDLRLVDRGFESDIAARTERRGMLRARHANLLGLLGKHVPLLRELEAVEKRKTELEISRDRTVSYRTQQKGFFRLESPADAEKAVPVTASLTQPLTLMALMALILAVTVAYLFEYLDTKVHSDYDIRRHLNLPVLSIFERLPRGESPLLLDITARHPIAEAFHRAATILRTGMQETEDKVMMVTSAVPEEGKTTMAVNLGVSFARKGLRVLLLDGDLRIPQLHHVFGVDNAEGLATLPARIEGEVSEALKSRLHKTGVEGLDVVVGGPTPEQPMGVLESPALAQVIEWARSTYDIVIFDTPPVTSVGDALVLAQHCDGVLMVVGAGIADRRTVTWAKHLLGTVKAKMYGAALNLAQKDRTSQYYYYYYYQYGAKSVRSRD